MEMKREDNVEVNINDETIKTTQTKEKPWDENQAQNAHFQDKENRKAEVSQKDKTNYKSHVQEIKELLVPFSKEELIHLLEEATSDNGQIFQNVRKAADEHPFYRKLYINHLERNTTADTIKQVFSAYGEIEEYCVIEDPQLGISRGAIVIYRDKEAAQQALKHPYKKIDRQSTVCHLGSPSSNEYEDDCDDEIPAVRKIYVSNVPVGMPRQKLLEFFSKYGEIEEGPVGHYKQPGAFRGLVFFTYKTVEGADKALEESTKDIDGDVVHCRRAADVTPRDFYLDNDDYYSDDSFL